jgi:hypothetical protein
MRFLGRAVLLGLLTCGCDAASSSRPAESVAERLAPPRPAATGHSSLSGRVVWSSSPPQVAAVQSMRAGPDGAPVFTFHPAPNVPAVAADGGVGNAVVFLRGVVDTGECHWPPVTVELHDQRPMIRQGDGPPGNLGFVRVGDSITIVSRQPIYHALRARGAAFWTLTLPDADRPRTWRLDQPGVVELSSGVNYYWMRSYLWVCDHPHYTPTAPDGRWTLAGVPAGEYDLVTWLPNWHTLRQERDPESGQIARYVFRPALEVSRRVVVRENESVAVGDVRINP